MKKFFYYTIILFFTISSCSTVHNPTAIKDDGRIRINFVQVNDVYEIAPLSGGNEGGMARVATIKQKYLVNNPNTFLVMAGDFLSPSVYNSLKYQGKPIRGKQMIEAMNAAGFDLAVFGNHEFDIKESELQERINESGFQWISSNTFHVQNNTSTPFTKTNSAGTVSFPVSFVKTVKDADGTVARIGFIGLTLPFNKAGYVRYTDALSTAKELYNQLKDSVDAVIAITHQSIEEDELLATEIPGLAAIMGGHEHDQRFEEIGNIPITKAMANARTAFIVKLFINKRNHKVKVITGIELLDKTVLPDSACNAVVNNWIKIAESSYASLGFDSKKVMIKSGESLDGRESEVRSRPTNLTRLIVNAMADAAPQADVVILNAGSIRVDDFLHMPVTQYDIIRTLPFGGKILEADMKGSLLQKILETGINNTGIGGFLHYNKEVGLNPRTNNWELKNIAIDHSKIYRVALPDFLLTGGEANLDFLKPGNSEIIKIYDPHTAIDDPLSDIRLAVIRYLEKK
jgi:2',3'-cyclic-nucleotide 2'-phosphodiesterase (5'-nucleotidase family)